MVNNSDGLTGLSAWMFGRALVTAAEGRWRLAALWLWAVEKARGTRSREEFRPTAFHQWRESVSCRERFALARELVCQRVEILGQRRNAAIVLLQIGSEIGALRAGEGDAFDLDVGDGGRTVLALAHAEGEADPRTRSVGIDELGLHQRIVRGTIQ